MKKYQNVILFSFLFVFFLLWNLFVMDLYADEVWNYGFSYAIYQGLTPYQDFNMIIPPLYPFFMAILFYLFGFNMIVFHIVNAIILTVLSYFMYRLIGNKMWFILIFLFFPLPNTYPSYNLLAVCLITLILYFEKEKKSDWWIGFLIGILILTKQSIGACFFLPSLYYLKDLKKFGKRLCGMMTPLVFFFIYLVCNGTLFSFLDLCFFGLFDFTKNTPSFNILYIFVLLCLGWVISWIWKDRKNLYSYYTLAAFSIVIPLFDFYHTQLFFVCLLLVWFMMKERKMPFRMELLFVGIVVGIGGLLSIFKFQTGVIYPNSFPHFETRMISKPVVEQYEALHKMLDKYPNQDFVYLISNAYFLRIERDESISFVDLINNGNHGYGGKEKLMKLIQERKNSYFLVDPRELDPKKQTNKEVIHYVMDHGEKIDEVLFYELYQLKEES